MRIEIVNVKDQLITYFELESNPFKIGETINIQVLNNDKTFWTVEEVKGDFVINKIVHFIRKYYNKDQRVSECFTVSVTVVPLNVEGLNYE